MSDIKWTFETKNSGLITAIFANGDIPQYRRGKTMSMTFKFQRSKTSLSSPATSAEYGDAEFGVSEFSSGGGKSERANPFQSVLEFDDYTDSISVQSTISGSGFYGERLPEKSTYDTNLVAVKPGDGITDFPGFWAIIIGVDDRTEENLLHPYAEIRFFVLAELSEYKDHSDVESELRKNG